MASDFFCFLDFPQELKQEGGRLSYKKPSVASMPADGAGAYISSVFFASVIWLETVSLRTRPLDLENASIACKSGDALQGVALL